MAFNTNERDPFTGWRNPAAARRRAAAARELEREPQLPKRKSAIELADEKVTVARGGVVQQIPATEALELALVDRAMGKLTDCIELYTRLDAEGDAALANPLSQLSEREKADRMTVIREIMIYNGSLREQLLALGVAEVTASGKLRVAASLFNVIATPAG